MFILSPLLLAQAMAGKLGGAERRVLLRNWKKRTLRQNLTTLHTRL
jgi:hypothetical protein